MFNVYMGTLKIATKVSREKANMIALMYRMQNPQSHIWVKQVGV